MNGFRLMGIALLVGVGITVSAYGQQRGGDTLAHEVGLWLAPNSAASPCGKLWVSSDDIVMKSGEAKQVHVFASFPEDGFALAEAEFDVLPDGAEIKADRIEIRATTAERRHREFEPQQFFGQRHARFFRSDLRLRELDRTRRKSMKMNILH
jgi:hypothetical protein